MGNTSELEEVSDDLSSTEKTVPVDIMTARNSIQAISSMPWQVPISGAV